MTVNDKSALFSKKQKKIISRFYNEIQNPEGNFARVKLNEKYGVINNKGDIIIDAEYSGLKYNREGMVAYQGENGKWGYMKLTPKTEKITEPLFEDIFYFKMASGWSKKSKEGEWIRINKNGRLFENKIKPPKKYNPYMFDKVGLAGTDVRTIKSDSVGQEYKLHIYLPKSYNENVN